MPSTPATKPELTLDRARALYRASGAPSLEERVERFKDAPACVEVSGRVTHRVTRPNANPKAFVRVPAGTHANVTWPKPP